MESRPHSNGGLPFPVVRPPAEASYISGRRTGDRFVSLIHTCELCEANLIEYLTELERHWHRVAHNSQAWMPWNYPQTLTTSASSGAL